MLETKVGNPSKRSRENVPIGWTELRSEQPQILKPRMLAIEYIPHKPIQTEEIIVIENSSVDQTRKTTVVKGGKKGKGPPCMVVHKMTDHFKMNNY